MDLQLSYYCIYLCANAHFCVGGGGGEEEGGKGYSINEIGSMLIRRVSSIISP
jgi:hypothetical protein